MPEDGVLGKGIYQEAAPLFQPPILVEISNPDLSYRIVANRSTIP